MTARPPIDYTSKDYASFVNLMQTDALVKLPEWTSRSPNDFGVVLIEEFAYLGDIQSVYLDRLANESYLPTATLRSSILNLAYLLDYRPDIGQAAKVDLRIGVQPGTGTVGIPRKSQFSSPSQGSLQEVIFETDADLFVTQDPVNVVYGTVSATQGTSVLFEALGPSSGLPYQRFQLLQAPVLDTSVEVYVSELADGGVVQWSFIEHLIDAGPDDRVYTTRILADGSLVVLFGDGVTGQIPYVGTSISSTYRVGGGTAGNVGAGTITSISCAPPGVVSVNNLSPASGGTDPETNDQIRVNAPRAITTIQRAVSLDDYANLCLRVAGVAKAKAGGIVYTNITVYIAPVGGGTATDALKERVQDYLSDKIMVNAVATLADPTYVPLIIEVEIIVLDNYIRGVVQTEVKSALQNMLAFENVDFAQSISVSDVYRTALSVPGVASANVVVLDRASSSSPGVDTVTMDLGEIPYQPTSITNVTILSGGIKYATGGPSEIGTEAVIPSAPGAPTIGTITCGTGHTFTMDLSWAAADDATNYRAVLNFYNGTTYVGSVVSTEDFLTNSGTVVSAFAGADTVRVFIRAFNGGNFADSPLTSAAYPCG